MKKIAAVVLGVALVGGMSACSTRGEDSAEVKVVSETVPNIVGLDVADAIDALKVHHLILSYGDLPADTPTDEIYAMKVLSQDLAPGSKADTYTNIHVTTTAPGASTDDDPAEDAKLARKVKKSLLSGLDIAHFSEAKSEDPTGYAGYVTDVSSESYGNIDVVLDISSDRAETLGFDDAARAILALTGEDVEDEQTVKVTSSDGTTIGTSKRSDIPALN